MRINKIIIENFKSIYGKQEFDFTQLDGLVKLSGSIGSGKSTISEAIRIGLFGNTKDNNNPNYISWNTDAWCIEMFLTSKNRNIYIRRHFREQLYVTIDDKELIASSKKDMQALLEEFYDVPRMAIEKMCVISFNQFNSLAKMNPGETRNFLDDVFGFKTFTEYNEAVVNERKGQISERERLDAIYRDTQSQINYLQEKKLNQSQEINQHINVDELKKERGLLIEEGIKLKEEKERLSKEYHDGVKDLEAREKELLVLGRKESEYYNKYKAGICPTCGQKMPEDKIKEAFNKAAEYRKEYKEVQAKIQCRYEMTADLTEPINSRILDIKNRIAIIDSDIRSYNSSLKILEENYDELIADAGNKLVDLNNKIQSLSNDIGQWNDMNELFTKTLRYNLLDTLIPHINNSIQYFITKLDQPYVVKFDQEFKCHVFIDSSEKEISYKDLSTGQKKSLDICIIFGIIQNIIANVDFNIFFLDELFSNMDAESREIMLTMLKENICKDGRSIFVVNHGEMADDWFSHKIRAKLTNKKMTIKDKKTHEEVEVFIHASSYEQVF